MQCHNIGSCHDGSGWTIYVKYCGAICVELTYNDRPTVKYLLVQVRLVWRNIELDSS